MGFLAGALPIIGGVVGGLFGGKGGGSSGGSSSSQSESQNSSQSSSYNKAYDWLNSTYAPAAQQGIAGQNFLAGLLGVPGGDATGAQSGLSSYYKMAGYAPALRDLSRQVTGGAAASGLLNSGATAKALLREGTKLNQSYFNNYLQNLAGLSGMGMQAGNLIGGAGNYSQSTSQGTSKSVSSGTGSSPGLFSNIASGIDFGNMLKSSGLFSDRRLKEDIERIGTTEGGLPIYKFRYQDDPVTQIGVMAQDVKELQPDALGPLVAGYMTVDYSKVH